MPILFDYFTLKIIWWLLVGALLIGFAVMDGFDLGVGALLPFVARTDGERRVLINSIGPTWEGNQVWFITGGGALFAAWPLVYAAAFSGFYWALLLVLFALFFRPVGFEYRSKVADPRWRSAWDWGLFVGGAVPALVFGVAFGNLLQGVPFAFDEFLRPFYGGNFFGLLNPFALLTGVVSLSMLVMHGAVYLQMRTDGVIAERAHTAVRLFGIVFIAAFVLAGDLAGLRDSGLPPCGQPRPRHLLQPARQDRGTGRRRVDGELCRPPLDVERTGPGGRRRGFGHSARCGRAHRGRLRAERGCPYRDHPDGGLCHVPVHHAIEHRPEREPDRLRCGLEPPHAEPDVHRRSGVPAHRAGLHELGLPGAAGEDHREADSGRNPLGVLVLWKVLRECHM